jgi:PAS domain S-box-containing protein
MSQDLRVLEARWRSALENAGDGVWDWDLPTGNVYFSPAWKSIIGYREDEIDNRLEEWSSRVHPDDLAAAELAIRDHIAGKTRVYRNEHRMQAKDGSWRWILDRGKIIEWDGTGRPLRMVGTHTDVTDRKEAEEQVKKLLEEKELLLKEVHHRVKNNMSLITSLISIQAGTMKSSEASEAMMDLKRRVLGMQLVYDRLFLTGTYDHTSLKAYLKALLKEIERSLSSFRKIIIEAEMDEEEIDPGRLFPAGLIVNELVTNSLKHAFPDRSEGKIIVNLYHHGASPPSFIRIAVQDDGCGITEDVAADKGGGFGMEMVRLMVRQLSGKLLMEQVESGGTKWTIDIPQKEQ